MHKNEEVAECNGQTDRQTKKHKKNQSINQSINFNRLFNQYVTDVDCGLIFLIDDEVDVLERQPTTSCRARTEGSNFIKHDSSDRGLRKMKVTAAYRWK